MSEDNLEPLVTQCPNCDTRFRVTEAQLQIAAGRVRCGACLSVFDGTQHLSVDGESLAVEDAPDVDALLDELDEVRRREPDVAPAMPVIDSDELIPVSAAQLAEADDSDEVLPEELLALETQLMQELRGETPAVDVPDQPIDELAEPLEEPFGIEVPEVVQEDAVEIAETIDDSTAETTRDADLEPGPEPEAETETETETEIETEQPAVAAADALAEADTDEPSEWLDEVTEDVWSDSAREDSAQDASEGEAGAQEDSAQETGEPDQVAAQAAEDAPGQPAPEAQASAAAAQAPTRNLGEVIELQALPGAPLDEGAAVVPDANPAAAQDTSPPLFDLDEQEAPPRRRSWLTLTFALLALFALPAQVLWFQYETWVMNADYRPIYQSLCSVAGCELPPMRDVSKIVSKRSFIRAHPERTDARIVDVLMVNNADFAQPYPLIELMATSLRGQLIAGRRFKPEEYLQGEAGADDLLPPRTPVHVSLEIADPAQEALNFEVTFR